MCQEKKQPHKEIGEIYSKMTPREQMDLNEVAGGTEPSVLVHAEAPCIDANVVKKHRQCPLTHTVQGRVA